jgi:hypothetical protein
MLPFDEENTMIGGGAFQKLSNAAIDKGVTGVFQSMFFMICIK